MRVFPWILWAVFTLGVASPADLLSAFRPSPVKTEYGPASEVEFSTTLIELESGALAHHVPYAMKNLQFAERVWMIGYRTVVVDKHRSCILVGVHGEEL